MGGQRGDEGFMKKVMLIGKLNDATKEISESISGFCQVQLCTDSVDIAEGMLRLCRPQLVILSLVGSSSSHGEIFALLNREARLASLIVIGSKSMASNLGDDGFLSDPRVHFLERPIKTEQVVRLTRRLLSGGYEEPEASKKAADGRNDGHKTILVVDDNPMLLRTVQSMLSRTYRVVFATSGTQAISMIAKSRPALILLDYDMPVCDGKQTFEMLQSEKETADIPVVFLTGLSEESRVREILNLKPNGYILKPPSEERILATISEVLEGAPPQEPEPPKKNSRGRK